MLELDCETLTIKESLEYYRTMWEWWLKCRHCTEYELQLAQIKISLIDSAATSLGITLTKAGS